MRTLISNGIVVNARRLPAGPTSSSRTRRSWPWDSRGAAPADRPLPVLAPGAVDRVIDARGRLVIPGGIDPHTHMELPVAGTVSRDTFETGTRAAAFGGTTTIIDFAGQTRGRSLREGLETWMARAEGRCAIDYGFHMMVNDVNDGDAGGDGQPSSRRASPTFKLFTAYPGVQLSDDGAILRAMLRTADNGGLILMHAENGVAIDVIAERQSPRPVARTPGITASRATPGLEAECVQRVIRLAEAAQVPVYIVHLSSRDALEEVVRGRERGATGLSPRPARSTSSLSIDDLGNGFEGAKFVCSPPLRPRRPPGGPLAGPGEGRPAGRRHRPLPLRLRAARRTSAAATSGKHPQRSARRRGAPGPPLPGGRGGPSEQGALGRGLLDRGGPDSSAWAAQGRHRPRLRRRHRHLRPRATPRPVGRDAPHGRRLLLLRGPRGAGWQRRRALARAGHRRGWRVPGPPG